MRSSIDYSAAPEPEGYPKQDRGYLVGNTAPPQHLTAPVARNTIAQEDSRPDGSIDLDDAFEAMTEKMNFDWPEFSPVDRIKAGLIQSALGLLLFLAMTAAFGFLHQNLIHQP